MSYVANQEYSPVPLDTAVSMNAEPQPSPEMLCRVKVSSRIVAVFCVLQLLLAAFGLFTTGSVFWFCITAIFVSLGLAGVFKRNPRLLIAHFVYSIVVYIFSLIGIVYMVLVCDECGIFTYLACGLYIIVQAIGLKHCRLLIWAIKTLDGSSCCGSSRSCQAVIQEPMAPAPVPAAPVVPMPMQSQTVVQQSATGVQSSTISSNIPIASAPVMMYPSLQNMPGSLTQGFQMQSFPMQPFPMQPYPAQYYPYPMPQPVFRPQQ